MNAFGRILSRSLAFAVFGVGQPALGEDVPDIAGRYEVEGVTVDKKTNDRREISGTITIVQTGATFTSHSEFKTITPGTDIVPAKVLGTGRVGSRAASSAEAATTSSNPPPCRAWTSTSA